MTSSSTSLIAAGLDLGSRNARIAIIKSSQSQQQQQNNEQKPKPTIVPNEIGERHTLALSLIEPETEADPLNDQYWDNPSSKKKKDADDEKTNEKSFIFGEAARRTLHRLKQPLAPHFISNLMYEYEGGYQDEDQEKGNGKEERLQAAQAFFAHLTNQATSANGTSAHPSSLRFVLSIPASLSSSSSSYNHLVQSYAQTVEKGIIKCMKQFGYDSSLPSSSLTKKEKKKLISKLESKNRVISIITNPVAIGHAHGIFQDKKDWKNMLIVEWGASNLSLTHLSQNNTSKLSSSSSIYPLTSIQNTITKSSSYSGTSILSILISHTAEIFERNSRGMIPRGETLLNKKAKSKLEIACEEALKSLSYSPKTHVTIDGLLDGIDCQVEIMLARFEMLLGNMIRDVESSIVTFVKDNVDGGLENLDGVLCSGGIMRMKCVESMMNRIFGGTASTIWRGKSIGDVAPEEAVALGCASFAHDLLESSFYNDDTEEEEEDDDDEQEEGKETNCEDANDSCRHVVEEDVLLSPIGVGLSLQEGDPAAIVMIEERTPLPALVTRNISLTDLSSPPCVLGVMQLTSNGNDFEKIIGKIEGIDTASVSSLEVTMELSCEGKLSVMINGGELFVI